MVPSTVGSPTLVPKSHPTPPSTFINSPILKHSLQPGLGDSPSLDLAVQAHHLPTRFNPDRALLFLGEQVHSLILPKLFPLRALMFLFLDLPLQLHYLWLLPTLPPLSQLLLVLWVPVRADSQPLLLQPWLHPPAWQLQPPHRLPQQAAPWALWLDLIPEFSALLLLPSPPWLCHSSGDQNVFLIISYSTSLDGFF